VTQHPIEGAEDVRTENFHDGHFDGIRLEENGAVRLFLRTAKKERCLLLLKGVQSLTLSEVKAGNIILDLVFRNSREATMSDLRELYGMDESSAHLDELLQNMRAKEAQILELNPSYGARGLFLFESCELIFPGDKALSEC
jgi:hypothetical protein